MALRVAIIIGYFGILLLIGWVARRRAQRGIEDYFLASRSLSPWILFLTMAATNFSAFTVFGFSGAGWESGYAFYPIMAFGTGFMALTFLLIGEPVRRLGKELGLITPPEMVFHLTHSGTLRFLFFLVMTVFTLPYLAMQPMAAGYALESLLGIPYFAGAALMTGVMLLYTFLGGFRGVTWTDVFQGSMLITLLLVAVGMIASRLGGLSVAHRAIAAEFPSLFARPGLNALYTPGVWFGYMLLWFFCDPMFPQLFQRFYAARDSRALATTMSLYPLLTGFLFLLPVTIGVLGRLVYPVLPAGTGADEILPLLLRTHTSPLVEVLVLTAALAALMSTLDSQLLTLSSMFTRDVAVPAWRHLAKRRRGQTMPPQQLADALPWVGKGFVVVLALVGLAIAWQPPATFLVIATKTFTGLAVLFPATIAGLYWKRMTARGAVASILVGEGLVLADHFELLPTFGTLPVIPILVVTAVVLVGTSYLTVPDRSRRTCALRSGWSRRAKIGWTVAFAGLLMLGHDFWAWGDGRQALLGYPWWVWGYAGLCTALAVAFWLFGRRCRGEGSH